MHILLSGVREVIDHGNGIIGLHLPAMPLRPEAQKVIDELFPNTRPIVDELLDREALLSCVRSQPLPDDGTASRIIYEGNYPANPKAKRP